MLTDALREELADENPEALVADGFESAYIGICTRFGQPPLAAYDYDKCIAVLEARGMSYEEAVEYFDYNVIGSWMGDGTPVFVRTQNGHGERPAA